MEIIKKAKILLLLPKYDDKNNKLKYSLQRIILEDHNTKN